MAGIKILTPFISFFREISLFFPICQKSDAWSGKIKIKEGPLKELKNGVIKGREKAGKKS